MEMDKHLVILDDKMLNEILFLRKALESNLIRDLTLSKNLHCAIYHDDGKYWLNFDVIGW